MTLFDKVRIMLEEVPPIILLHDPLRPDVVRPRPHTGASHARPRRGRRRSLQQLAEVQREARRGGRRQQRARGVCAAAEFGRAAYGPEVAERIAGVGERHVYGLGVREVADVVEEHGKRGRERAPGG